MRLLIATACALSLTDPLAGDSLISLLTDLTIRVPVDADVPFNAVVPKEWCVYSKWELEPEEENKPYMLRTEMFWPNGAIFNTYDLAAVERHNGMAFNVRANGFPIGQNGKVRIKLTLLNGDEVVAEPFDVFVAVNVTKNIEAGVSN